MRTFSAIFVFILAIGAAGAQTHPPASPPPAAAIQPTAGATPSSTPGAAQSDQSLPKFVGRVDEVNVVFTVTDKHGKFVKDLTQNQLRILDNNLPPQRVVRFQAETDLPLRVGLLIDASNSIRDRFQFEQQAATEFLQQIVRPKTDRAFVLAFDELPDVTQDFTNDLDKLTRGVKVIQPGGGTALWDAIYIACRDKLLKEPDTVTVRRAIILVSDGDDNQSRVLRQEAIDMAQRAGVIVYAISTNLMGPNVNGDKNLKMLADATGGRAFFPFKLTDVADAFHDVQEELRSQYSLAYRPDKFESNGQFRSIQILTEDKKLRVRAKKGYYAPRL